MPRYFDLDVRFWYEELRDYYVNMGFEKICCFTHQYEVSGIEIKASRPEDLKFDGKGKIVLLSSEKSDLLLAAAKRKEVDMLFSPAFLPDVPLIKVAQEHEKAFEVPLSIIIQSSGVKRAFLLSRIRFFLKLCNKYKADVVITSRANTKYQARTPKEMIAIGELLGLTHDQAAKALSAIPLSILEKKNFV